MNDNVLPRICTNKKKKSIVGSIYQQQQKGPEKTPPYDRRASFKEWMGWVLWFPQSASIISTPATKRARNLQRTSGQKEGDELQPQQVLNFKDNLFYYYFI